ncbi:hypothetical protein QA648_12565 [Rhizobium sp. CB3171]|uniref:hypothetical protein n=1 Tax=Rhizobium sp. CB3171 TaxID=3039157 RepID=UPI0024B0AA48|nr:hypothetical protein [Rhizobium sp. CB3171]WFU00985.1 hypothetical protein QA648_12565 [Rhizobium sp. CB3171]
MRAQNYYWNTFCIIKRDLYYLEEHEKHLDKIARSLNVSSAIASSSAIAGWALWKEIDFVWGAVIAVSQVYAAVKPYLPYGQRLKALNSLRPELDALATTAEEDWLKIASGMLTESEIRRLAGNLNRKINQSTYKHFKGLILPENKEFLAIAEEKTRVYMKTRLTED